MSSTSVYGQCYKFLKGWRTGTNELHVHVHTIAVTEMNLNCVQQVILENSRVYMTLLQLSQSALVVWEKNYVYTSAAQKSVCTLGTKDVDIWSVVSCHHLHGVLATLRLRETHFYSWLLSITRPMSTILPQNQASQLWMVPQGFSTAKEIPGTAVCRKDNGDASRALLVDFLAQGEAMNAEYYTILIKKKKKSLWTVRTNQENCQNVSSCCVTTWDCTWLT